MPNRFAFVKNLRTGKLEPADFRFGDEEQFSKLKLNIEREKLMFACEFCGTTIKVKPGSYVKEIIDENGIVTRQGYNIDKHWYHSEYGSEKVRNCPYYEGKDSSGGEYFPETATHFDAKIALAYFLEMTPGVSDVRIEKYIISDVNRRRRKPDVSFLFNSQRYSFEVQHSYISPIDIAARTDFFRKNGIVNFWIFPDTSPHDANSFEKDILYDNMANYHVFDDECKSVSENSGQLILKTWFKKRVVGKDGPYQKWESGLYALDDYSISEDRVPYVFDPEIENELFNIQLEIMSQKAEIEEAKWVLKSLQSELSDVQKLCAESERKIKIYKNRHNELLAEIKEATIKGKSLVDSLKLSEQKRNEILELSNQIDALTKEKNGMEDLIRKNKQLVESYDKTMDYWNRNIKEKARQYKELAEKVFAIKGNH